MYGLVNRAIHELVAETFGEATWEAVCAEVGIDPVGFVAMDSYPDKLTYDLVGAVSGLTGMEPNDVLVAFGKYWVEYTGMQGYGALMAAAGSTVPEFLQNLDGLHSRVSATYDKLQPPSFAVDVEDESTLVLHYFSHRPALEYLVVGLIQGLGQLLETPVEVELLRSRANGHDHDEFRVRCG